MLHANLTDEIDNQGQMTEMNYAQRLLVFGVGWGLLVCKL